MKRMLKYYRIQKGLTQKDLAKMIDVAPITIRKIEKCERNPSNKTARKISFVLDKKMDEVFPDIFLLSYDTKSIKN